MKNTLLIVLTFLWLIPHNILAQNKQHTTSHKLTVVVETKDGSHFVGKFLDRKNDSIVLQTKTAGLIHIAESQIKSINEVGSKTQKTSTKAAWFRNPFASQGLFFPTGIGLKKGEGFNSANYGITNHFSIAGGAEILSLSTSGKPALIYLQPKLSYSFSENFHVSGGGYLFSGGLGNNRSSGVIPFGNLTVGNRNNNLTFGTYIPTKGNTFFLIAGQVRTVQSFGLICELYILNGIPFLTMGGRYITEKVCLNFGLFRPVSSSSGDSVGAIPYLGVVVPFGYKGKQQEKISSHRAI
jgi:hypothetical protein